MALQVVNLVDKEKSIFAQNPGLEVLTPFNELYEKGEDGDRIMKALFFIYDIKSSAYQGIPDDKERIADISENYLMNPTFPWKDYGKYSRAYKTTCVSDIQKKLDIMRMDIDEREAYFRGLSWDDPEERDIKNKMMSDHDKFIEKYEKVMKLAEEELEELESYGGYIKSYIESLGIEQKRKVEG